MQTLSSCTLLGTPVAQADCGPVRVSVTNYPAGTRLPWHAHADAYVTLISRGGYQERTRSETRQGVAGSILVHADGEIHENHFGDGPTRCVNVFVEPSWRPNLLANGGLGGSAVLLPSPATRIL